MNGYEHLLICKDLTPDETRFLKIMAHSEDSDVPNMEDLTSKQMDAMGPALMALQNRTMCDACLHWIAEDADAYTCSKCTEEQRDLCGSCFNDQKTGCDHDNCDYIK